MLAVERHHRGGDFYIAESLGRQTIYALDNPFEEKINGISAILNHFGTGAWVLHWNSWQAEHADREQRLEAGNQMEAAW
ncbi:MAG: hypothetical protein FWE06_01480 [Oscillospiraceae bacterium]|nr:hypothetical protein [Oscillospiraceae bacterium]